MELNHIQEVKISAANLRPKKQNVFDQLGYTNTGPDQMVIDIVDKYIAECKSMVDPSGGFILKKLLGLDLKSGTLTIDDQLLSVGKIIASQLKGAEYIALFICTIGKNLVEASNSLLKNGDLVEGYTLNLIGSEAAEEAAEAIFQHIRSVARQNELNTTNRFSPGYCNWNVKEQFQLFSFFPGQPFGVSLTGSALMSPLKSVSGIIGIGADVQFSPYTCARCGDDKCLYKNRKSA
jgi:hypothetical protein